MTRVHVLAEARKTYRRLKRQRLILDRVIWPDQSSKIVAVLASYAYDMHTYLQRAGRRGGSR